MKDQERILNHLKICGYQVEDITFVGYDEIEDRDEELYLAKIVFLGETVERIVYWHSDCLSMISKNIQVKDMMGNDDQLIFPRGKGQDIKLISPCPITDITPDTVLFYEDYVSLREHFFQGNRFIQIACWIRNDESIHALDFEKYGRYILSVFTTLDE